MGPPEILRGEIPRLDHGAHGSVEDQDAVCEGLGEDGGRGRCRHALILAYGCPITQRRGIRLARSPSRRIPPEEADIGKADARRWVMTIRPDHTNVPAKDKAASGRVLSR